jgi:hypothetical protein
LGYGGIDGHGCRGGKNFPTIPDDIHVNLHGLRPPETLGLKL